MVTAWYLDNDDNRSEDVLLQDIYAKTGILYYKLNVDSHDMDEIRKERQFGYQDILDISRENLPNYDERIKGFQAEHQHPDEEIRMIIKGITYFDVRDKSDQWIRLRLTPGDLVILPPMIFHRLTLHEENPDVVVRRLFKESPNWTAFNRDSEITQ